MYQGRNERTGAYQIIFPSAFQQNLADSRPVVYLRR